MECYICLFITPSGVRTFFASGGDCDNTQDTQEHMLLQQLITSCRMTTLSKTTIGKNIMNNPTKLFTNYQY